MGEWLGVLRHDDELLERVFYEDYFFSIVCFELSVYQDYFPSIV